MRINSQIICLIFCGLIYACDQETTPVPVREGPAPFEWLIPQE